MKIVSYFKCLKKNKIYIYIIYDLQADAKILGLTE